MQPPASAVPPAPPSARLTPFVRFLLGHTLAYVPGFLWAAATIPDAIVTELASLSAEVDESAIRSLMMRKMVAPFALAFLLPHLLLVPWVRSDDAVRGRALFLVGTALECIAAIIYGVYAWATLLSS
jgi:hypothetical protein